AYASPSAGLRTTLNVRSAGLSGTIAATMLTQASFRAASSSMNVTYTQQALLRHPAKDLRTQEGGVFQRCGGEALVHDDDAAAGGVPQDVVNPDQLIFELAPQILQILFFLEVSEDAVGQEEPS